MKIEATSVSANLLPNGTVIGTPSTRANNNNDKLSYMKHRK